MPTAADKLYEVIRSAASKHLFGMDSPEALYAAADPNETKFVTVRDEGSGVIMADAYARVTGQATVCTSVRGPGATRLISGLAEANASSSPVVAVVSDVSADNRGRNQIQEIDQLALFSTVSKSAMRLDRPARATELARRAFSLATGGRPGPVVLSCPDDVLGSKSESSEATLSVKPALVPSHRPMPDPSEVRQAVDVIAASTTGVAILAGSGVLLSGATEELAILAELLGAPVATTPQGKGAFDETNPLSLGVSSGYNNGRGGQGLSASKVIRAADVVLVVGSKADSIATDGWMTPPQDAPGTQIVRIDIEFDVTTRNYQSAIPLIGDAKAALRALIEGLSGRDDFDRYGLRELTAKARSDWDLKVGDDQFLDAGPIRPERLIDDIGRVIDDDAIICTDASYSAIWPMDRIRLAGNGRRFLSPRGFAGLGWGLPAALGAKLARPESTVICVTGDGGFAYVYQELETAARYNIPVVVVVLNNRTLGYQKHYEQMAYGRTFDTDLLDVNHAELARVLHCTGIRVNRPADFPEALSAAVASGLPTVLDCVVDADAYPPIGSFDALGHNSATPSTGLAVH